MKAYFLTLLSLSLFFGSAVTFAENIQDYPVVARCSFEIIPASARQIGNELHFLMEDSLVQGEKALQIIARLKDLLKNRKNSLPRVYSNISQDSFGNFYYASYEVGTGHSIQHNQYQREDIYLQQYCVERAERMLSQCARTCNYRFMDFIPGS